MQIYTKFKQIIQKIIMYNFPNLSDAVQGPVSWCSEDW